MVDAWGGAPGTVSPMKLRCMLGSHDWEYFSGDRFDDWGQRCTRCPKEIIYRHADERPASVAADPARRRTAMQRAAARATARPAVGPGSTYGRSSSTGERNTDAQLAAIQASARSAHQLFATARVTSNPREERHDAPTT